MSPSGRPLYEGAPSQTSDAMMVVEVDRKKRKVVIQRVPRDTMAYISRRLGWDKVNMSISEVGAKRTRSVAGRLLGCKIDHYVVLTIPEFLRLFEIIGGVAVPAGKLESLPIVSPQDPGEAPREKGDFVLKGYDALRFVMERIGSDAERLERQEIFISSFVNQRKRISPVKAIKLAIWVRKLDMDMSLIQAARCAWLILASDREFRTIPTAEIYLNCRAYVVSGVRPRAGNSK